MENTNTRKEQIQVNHLKKIEIKNLWGKYDLEWELNAGVNILAGANGSGKSTVLDIIFAIQEKKFDIIKQKNIFDECILWIDEANFIKLLNQKNLNTLKLGYGNPTLPYEFHLAFTRTFDIPATPLEIIQKYDENAKTELDFGIHRLQNRYLDYQINLNKRKDKILETSTNENIKEEITELNAPHVYFLDLLNELFTDGALTKKVDTEKNEIAFLLENNKEITAYQLSAGEKQMLILLLQTLLQNQRPTIFLLDEPETALHFDWQKKLISYIQTLNPYAQIIIATHSPAIIMKGYMDKVTNMSDILKPHVPETETQTAN